MKIPEGLRTTVCTTLVRQSIITITVIIITAVTMTVIVILGPCGLRANVMRIQTRSREGVWILARTLGRAWKTHLDTFRDCQMAFLRPSANFH